MGDIVFTVFYKMYFCVFTLMNVMQKLYFFNPESDLALANNDENYMPPLAVRKLGADLAMLPVWYAEAGSYVLTESHPHALYFSKLKDLFQIPVQLITFPEMEKLTDVEVCPWGWSMSLRKQLFLPDIASSSQGDIFFIHRLRELSSKRMASNLLSGMPTSPYLCGESFILTQLDDLYALDQSLLRFLLKAPLSGSGRGLKWCRNGLDEAAIKWFKKTVEQQDCVIGEPIYDKVEDLAMEFEILNPNTINFIGYSSFSTTPNGAYMGNYLLSDELFAEVLETKYFYSGFLDEVKSLLKEKLLLIYGADYRGVLGVDMMVCQFESSPIYRLHPCVEVNLRMNMGIVSRVFYERYVQQGKQGKYQVDFMKKSGELLQRHIEWTKKHPLVVEEGRIVKGYLSLCPITRESQYHAWVLIE